MNEQSRALLERFANTPGLMDAVESYILGIISDELPTATGFSNEILGQIVRSRSEASDTIKKAFKSLSAYKKSETVTPYRNDGK